jgi:hypothetical protein
LGYSKAKLQYSCFASGSSPVEAKGYGGLS